MSMLAALRRSRKAVTASASSRCRLSIGGLLRLTTFHPTTFHPLHKILTRAPRACGRNSFTGIAP